LFPELQFRLFSGDNFGYFLRMDERSVVAVDVPDGSEMAACLDREGWTLEAVLLTHTHWDHVAGLEELMSKTGCELIAPAGAAGVPVDRRVEDGERFQVGGLRVEAMDTSGHSELDFSYYLPDPGICFCGDSLFAWGCGRMFAGPPDRFWSSLQKLRGLPGDTLLACGHDYSADNLQFIKKHLAELTRFAEFLERVGEMSVMPVRLSEQIEHNPFLRADDPEIAGVLDLSGADPAAVFARLREMRNRL
jgi:hydroxyacylglutathione hydrolase